MSVDVLGSRPNVMYGNWMATDVYVPPPLQFTKKRTLLSASKHYKIYLPKSADGKHYDISVQLNSLTIKHKESFPPQASIEQANTDLEKLLVDILFRQDSFRKGMSLYLCITTNGASAPAFSDIKFTKPVGVSTHLHQLVPLTIEFSNSEKYKLLYLFFFITNKVPGEYLVTFDAKGAATTLSVNPYHPYLLPSSGAWDPFVIAFATFYTAITTSPTDVDLYICSLRNKYSRVVF